MDVEIKITDIGEATIDNEKDTSNNDNDEAIFELELDDKPAVTTTASPDEKKKDDGAAANQGALAMAKLIRHRSIRLHPLTHPLGVALQLLRLAQIHQMVESRTKIGMRHHLIQTTQKLFPFQHTDGLKDHPVQRCVDVKSIGHHAPDSGKTPRFAQK